MTREQEISILMDDNCTPSEAEKHLKNDIIIFEESDLQEHFQLYVEEWQLDEEDAENFRIMLDGGTLLADWGKVKQDEKIFYIMYCL